MNFSTALKLIDVDDYIAPSLECVKPVKIPVSAGKTKSITIGDNGSYSVTDESGHNYTLSKAKIELNDCLACSGCITTAETVLVSQQSSATLLDLIKAPEKTHDLLVSISPQSLASLTIYLTNKQTHLSTAFAQSAIPAGLDGVRHFCTRVLKSRGIEHVFDTTWGRDLSLAASIEEFIGAYHVSDDKIGSRLPLLSGICPGWICYAEKTHFKAVPSLSGDESTGDSFLLSHLSKVRSAQQLFAGVLKSSDNSSQRPLYTIFVEPCYDRKLEATRNEFSNSQGEKDTDLVVGTNEFVTVLEAILQEDDCLSFTQMPIEDNETDNLFASLELTSDVYRHFGSGSGGYAINILRAAADELFHIKLSADVIDDSRVLLRPLGNPDMQEIILFETAEHRDSAKISTNGRSPYRLSRGPAAPTPLLVFAVANGLRNIQTVVQLLKRAYTRAHSTKQSLRSVLPFDYVEVMACPSGCLNGGAQLKEAPLTDVSGAYFSAQPRNILSSDPSHRLRKSMDAMAFQQISRTTYRTVPKVDIINPSALMWYVEVIRNYVHIVRFKRAE